MPHEISPSRSTLPPIEDWRTGDSRRLAYTVTVDDQGTPKDITEDELSWSLLRKPYQERADALLTDESSGVHIRRSPYTDPTAGEFEVRIEEDTLSEWGGFWQRVVLDPLDDTRQSWLGTVSVSSRGGGGDSV